MFQERVLLHLTAEHAGAVPCGMPHQLQLICSLGCCLLHSSTCTIAPDLPASDSQDAAPVCPWQLVRAALQSSLIDSQMLPLMLCSHRESNTNANVLEGRRSSDRCCFDPVPVSLQRSL